MHAWYYVGDHGQWDGWIKQKEKKKTHVMQSTNLELSIPNVCIFPIVGQIIVNLSSKCK